MPDFSRYEQPTASQRDSGLYCTGFGGRSPSSACGPRTLPTFAAVFIEQGAGALDTTSSGRLEVRAPALFWLFPGTPHRYGPLSGGWSERWVMFEGTQAQAFLRLEYLSPSRPLLPLEEPLYRELSALFDGLQRDFTRQTRFAPLLGGAWVHRLVLTTYAAEREQLERDPAQQGMRQALELLEQAAFGPLNLGDFARQQGMSPATFRRRVRELTGCSPQEHLTRLRLARAKTLLVQTASSVLEVGQRCGFEDPFYFSRVFHQFEGLSPSAFRAQQRRTGPDSER